MTKKTAIAIMQPASLMAHPPFFGSLTRLPAVLVPAGQFQHTPITRIMKTRLALPLALTVVVIAPFGGITPFSPSMARHASKVFPAPAPGEFRLGHRLRLLAVNTAGDFPIRTAHSPG
jgi:hypothetical protein